MERGTLLAPYLIERKRIIYIKDWRDILALYLISVWERSIAAEELSNERDAFGKLRSDRSTDETTRRWMSSGRGRLLIYIILRTLADITAADELEQMLFLNSDLAGYKGFIYTTNYTLGGWIRMILFWLVGWKH